MSTIKEIIAGSSVSLSAAFNAEYDTSRMTALRMFLNRQKEYSLAGGTIQDKGFGLYVVELSGASTFGLRGDYALQIEITDSILGVVNIAPGTIKFLQSGAPNSGSQTSQAATITVPVTISDTGVTTNEIVISAYKGDPGASAYEQAVAEGFEGTKAEWLESLEGDPATIAVGTVTTGDPGTDAEVTDVGTPGAAVLNFKIPRGLTGKNVEFQKSATHVQYRLEGAEEWIDLVALADISGETYYVYDAYASDDSGTNFSLIPSDSLKYTAHLTTPTQIVNPQASDFAGLWVKYIGDDGGSTLNTPPTLVALSAYEVDMTSGEYFSKTCGASSAFTLANVIIWKPFCLILTGGSLSSALFTGYSVSWIHGSLLSDYNNAATNYLWCQVRSAGQVYVFWGA